MICFFEYIWAYEMINMSIWGDEQEHMMSKYVDGGLVYGHQMKIYMNLEVLQSSKLSVDEKTNGTFMHFWWMFFSSSLAKMKWAEVETYMIIFGFVLFSGLARWKIFSIEIMIDIPKGSHQNWPSLDQNWLHKRFGSKLAKSKVAVRENAAGTQSTWVLPSNSPWR